MNLKHLCVEELLPMEPGCATKASTYKTSITTRLCHKHIPKDQKIPITEIEWAGKHLPIEPNYQLKLRVPCQWV